MGAALTDFIQRWEGSSASERQTKDQFLLELCDVLGVPRPEPASGDPARDRYVFEYPVREVDEEGKVHTTRIDLYKEGCFLLEAKQGAAEGAKKAGTARRNTNAWHIAMNDAYGQALGYARNLKAPVPIVVVCDIGYCFDLYESFDGSGAYRHFPTAQTSRLYFRDLERHVETLRAVFTDPHSLDPSRKAAKVTREVAEYLANLAKNLEEKGHAQETVARFLMRCLFTMFAEDIQLLPDHLFTRLLREHWVPHPKSFPGGVQALWEKMNTGGEMVLARVRHFNGGLFRDTAALPLDDHALRLLLTAAERDWAEVEPAIFGTLLERALDKKERHRLGAHYTPRAYVERLVRPTIEEPLRAEWDVVKAEVAKLRKEEEKARTASAAKRKRTEAIKLVHAFHKRLSEVRVLDPACGSGNFLYVALHIFQQIESEVLSVLESLGEAQDVLRLEGLRITPAQFLGIEIKPWAKEIAELVLWIGYLQWHYRMLGKKPPVFEPVLHDYKNIEQRDAILAYDREELLLDEKGKPVTRWDGETTKIDPKTKRAVPDEGAVVPVYRYVNPRKAKWPTADFVVGNPPFIANRNMRSFFGEDYVASLRRAYVEFAEPADFVMFFWARGAEAVSTKGALRVGLITTNSIRMAQNQGAVIRALAQGCKLVFAIPDHPWPGDADSAEIRVSMTVLAHQSDVVSSRIVLTPIHDRIARGKDLVTDVEEQDLRTLVVEAIPPDLSPSVDVSRLQGLVSNQGLSSAGMKPYSRSLVVTADKARQLIKDPSLRKRYAPEYRNGHDIGQRPRHVHVLDFDGLTEEQLRIEFPEAYQFLLGTAKPERSQERNMRLRSEWWLFEASRPDLRAALLGISRYIVTVENSPVRAFVFLAGGILPDQKLRVIASGDAFILGVLSSRAHNAFALRAGGRQGVRNTPVYNTRCFTQFPFPDPTERLRKRIASLAEALDAHRKARQGVHPDLTITGMYNVLEKFRNGEPLNDKEAAINEKGLIAILGKLHDDLDSAVFEAYGWPPDLTDEQILEKLVALNAERAEEEKRGVIRWLRPDFQNPSGKKAAVQATIAETESEEEVAEVAPGSAKPWPKKLPEQLTAMRELLGRGGRLWTAERAAAAFTGAKPDDVKPILESLATLGLAIGFNGEEHKRWKGVAAGIA